MEKKFRNGLIAGLIVFITVLIVGSLKLQGLTYKITIIGALLLAGLLINQLIKK